MASHNFAARLKDCEVKRRRRIVREKGLDLDVRYEPQTKVEAVWFLLWSATARIANHDTVKFTPMQYYDQGRNRRTMLAVNSAMMGRYLKIFRCDPCSTGRSCG